MASLKSEERWQTKTSTVLERNKYIFNHPLLSDINFAFPDTETTIPAHKHVLAVSSPVFFTMFFGDLAEIRDTMDITDCDSDIFLRFLRFIYCDEATFGDIDGAIKVWYLADKYDVPSLAKECAMYLDGNMDPLRAFDVLTCARQFSDEGLETACWEVIDYNAEAIVADDSFLDVKHESLSSFVERSSARIKETTLFKALDRWAAKRCEEASMTVNGENKRAFMGENLLKQFRFSLMSPNEFSDVVLPTKILLLTEVIDVFKQFTSVSIPGGFKFSLCPRKTCDAEPRHSHSTGNVHVPGTATSLVNEKSGLLTFTVKRDSSLSGVKIVTDKGQESCRVSLSINEGGKMMRQIKDKHFTCKDHKTSSYGEINVVFNRPFPLSKNTCYGIETETDTTNNLDSGFVCQPKSLQLTSSAPPSQALSQLSPTLVASPSQSFGISVGSVTQSTGSTTSLFGSSSQSSSLFGAPAQPAISLSSFTLQPFAVTVGSVTQSTGSTTSLFGSSSQSTSLFGVPAQPARSSSSFTLQPFAVSAGSVTQSTGSTTSLFGSSSQSSSLFGASAQPAGFSSSCTSQSLGISVGSVTQSAGSRTSVFGFSSQSSSLFGATVQAAGLSSSCTSQSSSPFGGNFVQPAGSVLFGKAKDDIISCHSFGNCDKNWPEHSEYGGEITKLVFRG